MIPRGQLTDHSVDLLLFGVENLGPALYVAFLDDVEQVTDFALSHNDFTLVVPLGFEAVQEGQLFKSVQILEQVDLVEES